MIPTFVISLPDCTDRRRRIAVRLNELSLPFEFVDAVDGRNRLPEEYEALVDWENAITSDGFPISEAEFGCALSHIKVYQKVLERGIPYALILEDDAIPLPDLADYIAGRHFVDADLTSLYYFRKAYVRKRFAKHLFGHYKSHLCVPKIDILGAVGYIVSIDAVRHLVKNALPVNTQADWPTCAEHFKRQGRWRLIHPRLVEHPPIEEGCGASILNDFGRTAVRSKKKKRRMLGVYIPPRRYIVSSWRRGILLRLQSIHEIK